MKFYPSTSSIHLLVQMTADWKQRLTNGTLQIHAALKLALDLYRLTVRSNDLQFKTEMYLIVLSNSFSLNQFTSRLVRNYHTEQSIQLIMYSMKLLMILHYNFVNLTWSFGEKEETGSTCGKHFGSLRMQMPAKHQQASFSLQIKIILTWEDKKSKKKKKKRSPRTFIMKQ